MDKFEAEEIITCTYCQKCNIFWQINKVINNKNCCPLCNSELECGVENV